MLNLALLEKGTKLQEWLNRLANLYSSMKYKEHRKHHGNLKENKIIQRVSILH